MNPYEAPPSAKTVALEQKLAGRLLDLREKNFTYGDFYRRQAPGYVALFLLSGLGIAYWVAIDFQPGAAFMVGTLFGVLLRDLGFARLSKRTWPFQARWMDWNKVKQSAGYDALDALSM